MNEHAIRILLRECVALVMDNPGVRVEMEADFNLETLTFAVDRGEIEEEDPA